ncbi:hypothetical protein ACHWQZ_G013935 [Mnemiopsis leidyi]
MIGLDSLYERLLLDHSPPTFQSDFQELFLSVKHSTPHISTFNSKIFYSALLSDLSLPPTSTKLLSNVWLRNHGFTRMLSIDLLAYLTAVQGFQLEKHFIAELRSLPAAVYSNVSDRVLQIIVDNKTLGELIPHVFEVDVLMCKIGVSSGAIFAKCLEHATKRIHSFSDISLHKLVQNISEISFLVCYTGTGTVLRKISKTCHVTDALSNSTSSPYLDQIPPSDAALQALHLNQTCCQFEELLNVNTHFTHLSEVYQAGVMLQDSLAVHAVCDNKAEKLVHMYSLCTYVLSSQLHRALYTAEHVTYLEKLLDSVPEEHFEMISSSPIYKALNFDPESASWEELVTQVRNGLSRASDSFNVMMNTCKLDFGMIEDCISLLKVLSPAQMALAFRRTFGADHSNIPLMQKVDVTRNVMDTLKKSSPRNISNFNKCLHIECGFSISELEQLSLETKNTILGDHRNVTKVINQLGSKGSGKWKEALYHSLLVNFTLSPDKLLEGLIGQATRNKALSSPVAVFLRDFLPFTLNPLIPVAEVVFTSLKSEFKLLKTLKEVRQFDAFVEALKPIISHQIILKLLLLPLTKSCEGNQFTTLSWIQLYLQREPFYNFSLFYELVRIWANPDIDGACSELLDDGDILDNLGAQIKDYPKEGYLMLKMITQGWGWKAGLRFQSIMDYPRVKLPKMIGELDLSDHVVMKCLSFVEGEFKEESGEPASLLSRCLLQLAKYSRSSLKFRPLKLDQCAITDSVFTEFGKISVRSIREWTNIYNFLNHCFIENTLNMTRHLNDNGGTSDLSCTISRVSDVFREVELNPQHYLSNDVLTFVVLSTVSGNKTSLRYIGRACESFISSLEDAYEAEETGTSDTKENRQSIRTFVLLCVLLKISDSKSLETLLMSMAPSVDIGQSTDVKKALGLLPDSMQSTLSLKTVSNINNRNLIDGDKKIK